MSGRNPRQRLPQGRTPRQRVATHRRGNDGAQPTPPTEPPRITRSAEPRHPERTTAPRRTGGPAGERTNNSSRETPATSTTTFPAGIHRPDVTGAPPQGAAVQQHSGFPQARGDPPDSMWFVVTLPLIPPPPRAVGHTFEFSFPIPKPANSGNSSKNQTKAARKSPRTNPKTRNTTKAAANHPAVPDPSQMEDRKQQRTEYDRQRDQTPERREYYRLHAQERRRKAKELGLCKSCPNPAKPVRPAAPPAPRNTGSPASAARPSGEIWRDNK